MTHFFVPGCSSTYLLLNNSGVKKSIMFLITYLASSAELPNELYIFSVFFLLFYLC